MESVYDRTKLLIGDQGISRLQKAAVIVFGLGGVGGMAVEALARAGIGKITLVDFDKINLTNINRQIFALHSTLNKYKVDVARERINDINPDINVETICSRVLPDSTNTYEIRKYDFVIDAIDDVNAKVSIINEAYESAVPIVSSMGTGNKTDPDKLTLCQLKDTHTCPLAKAMRVRLRKMGIEDLSVVYSTEKPHRSIPKEICGDIASISFVPTTAGLLLAGKVIRDIIER